MKVLLLGGNGLLGQNVLRELLGRGHLVHVLVRNRQSIEIDHERLRVFEGSLLDFPTLRNAGEGAEAVINCAGTTDMSLLSYSDYLPVNKGACEMVLQMMDELGIGTLVHVSTANTIGYGKKDAFGTEESEMESPFAESFYAQSKQEAEQMLQWEAMEHKDRHIVIVNPGFIVGPYDRKPSSGTMLLAGYRRKVMVAPKGGKSYIDARCAATAIVNALQMGRNGERYLLTDVNMSVADFYRLEAEVCGYKQRVVVLPNWLALTAGKVGDFVRWLGVKCIVSTRNVKQMLVMEYYDNTKARTELGLPPTDLRKAIEAFFETRRESSV